MTSTTHTTPSAAPRRAVLSDPGYQAFVILRAGFTVAPILFGLDKFANLLVDWPAYLAPWIDDLVPGGAQAAMYAVGVIEIVAGLAVALVPRFGGWLVAGWLAGIIVNLLTIPGATTSRCATSASCSARSPSPGSPSATTANGPRADTAARTGEGG
jgi:uncharacterized membrane protein YphA (DoxX/SURF4 family)